MNIFPRWDLIHKPTLTVFERMEVMLVVEAEEIAKYFPFSPQEIHALLVLGIGPFATAWICEQAVALGLSLNDAYWQIYVPERAVTV